MPRTVHCVKLGKEAEGLDFPPVPGDLGKRLWESVSKEAWAGWLKHQTMLVNENRLTLADLEGAAGVAEGDVPLSRRQLAERLHDGAQLVGDGFLDHVVDQLEQDDDVQKVFHNLG